MDAAAADSTQDWLVPEAARPPTVAELERRIEEALVTARASEAAIMSVGASALDAAEQARRAAALAERASLAAAEARDHVASTVALPGSIPTAADGGEAASPTGGGAAEAGPADGDGDEGLGDFSERADRLVARLRQLQRVPLPEPASSAGAEQPRPGR